MKKRILICAVLICSMLLQTCVVSLGSTMNYDEITGSVSNLEILSGNKLPDGTAINASEQCMYVKGGFKEGAMHVADRTFILSDIADTDLIGSDLIGWAFETYKDNTTVHSWYKTNHNVNEKPGILNWINFNVDFDADIYIYTSREKGIQPDNDRALEAAGFTFVAKNSSGYMKSSVAIANNTYYGKWVKSVKGGDRVSLPSNRSGSAEGRVTPVAVIKYNIKTLNWPAESSHGRDMPFNPSDKYVSTQNPPVFTWKYVSSATSYNLAVAKDYNFTDVVKSYVGITTNYFNMPDTLTPGETYYWKVRYITPSGVSKWTEPRRFRIDTDAYEFTFPGIEEIMGRIPQSHPRILTTPDTADDFRALKDTESVSGRVYDYYISLANGYVNEYAKGEEGMYSLKEPVFEDAGDDLSYLSQYRSKAQQLTEHMYRTGFAYFLSGEEKYGELAKKMILSLSTWCMKDDGNGNLVYDPDGQSSYKNQDQVHRYITYRSAMVYDWIYNILSEDERKVILNMIEQRTLQMTYLLDNLKNSPYDSHGWTAFGFIGIIGIATYGEIEGAEDWLRTIIPAYTAMLPPWGYQDGGWSQGTDYWQYSTCDAQEFMDVLVQGGIIDLYKTAWIQNEYLWSLYAYPAGSYGSFGDQSNRTKAGSYSIQSLINEVNYNQNPVAKWLVERLGGTTSNVIDNYYTANIDHIESKEPTDYPLGHEFNDIGWVIMTNDLVDEDRIQMTFKSSPYGSFNHSHPDQNAFIIQAFGENLANKSGYYDWYHSDHDNHITRPTFSHNTITVDGGKGQRDDDFTAKGQMLQFVTHHSFDSATGDATDAYKGTAGISAANYYKGIGELDKFVRDIIYVRPGVFVVIDDLEAAKGGSSSFEWWLNAEHEIEYTNTTALIKENHARLSANIVYPANVKARYYDGFYSPYTDSYYPDTYYAPAAGYVGANEQRKVCFYTPKVAQTKIVATMSVYEDDETQEVISTKYSADGSYLTLDFADGTRCIVNLGNDTDTVTDGIVTFTGDAVTYNAESVMLTNGTFLKYGEEQLVSSHRAVTVAMGGGSLAISVTGDSNNCVENSLILGNGNRFVNVQSLNDLKDSKGRTPSAEIGLPQSFVSSDAIQLYPYEGNYNLSVDGLVVNPLSIKPNKVAIDSITEESFVVTWEERDQVNYDIIINNTIYENVSSPYRVAISEDEKVYDIAVRGTIGAIVSPWSSGVYYSPNGKSSISYVKYSCDDGVIKARVFSRNPSKDKINFYLVEYKADGNLGEIDTRYVGDKYTEVSLPYNETSTYKAFLWEEDITPLKSSASYGASGTDLRFILADGVAIDGFENTKDEYTINLPGETYVYPVITPVPADNTTKLTVSNHYADNYSEVTVTSATGESRVIKINYALKYDNIHVITGATEERDFKYDTARSETNGVRDGMVSNANVVTLEYDLVKNGIVTPQTVELPVYTNLHPAYSASTFGSRLTSDRNPNSGNFTEFNAPADGFTGYDHIVFPNNDFYVMQNTNVGSAVKNARVTFGLSAPAEVYVLSTEAVSTKDIMLSQGFEFDGTQPISRGRYMDTIGVEDIYYNVNILGKDKNQIGNYSLTSTSGVRFKNYEYAPSWVDVSPIDGCTTVQSYIDGGYDKNDFIVVGTCEARIVKGTYLYDSAYVKRYEDITGPTEITIDFGSFPEGANRMILVVRPVTPKAPISGFEYEGPTTYEALDSSYKVGCTDDYEAKRSFETAYAVNPVVKLLEDGAGAYADTTSYKIGNIDPMLELDGVYFVPQLFYLTDGNVNNAWMKAYYYGLERCNGYEYPSYPGDAMPMYSFKLERSADLYVVTSGFKPPFIDSTWQKITLDKPAFTVSDNKFKYNEMYVKHVDVEEGSPITVTMTTINSGDTKTGLYYTLIKLTE